MPSAQLIESLDRYASPTPQEDLEALEAADLAQKDARLNSLYVALGRVANDNLPDVVVSRVLRRLPAWDYDTKVLPHGRFKELHRRFLETSVLLNVPENQPERRRIVRDREGFGIIVPDVTGDDLRLVISIERGFRIYDRRKETATLHESPPEPQYRVKPPVNERLAKAFKRGRNEWWGDDGLLTVREAVALSAINSARALTGLGSVLGSSPSEASRTLTPLKNRLGGLTHPDLCIIAVALGLDDLDHIPAGLTDIWLPSERKLFAAYYHPDIILNPSLRHDFPAINGSKWSRAYEKLGPRGEISRQEAVQCALKDGLIVLPPADKLYLRLSAVKRKIVS